MKRKDRPNIPDFSKKRPSSNTIPQGSKSQQQPVRASTPVQTVKPHSTSAKSGRRGS